MQELAWALSSECVTEYLTKALSLSECKTPISEVEESFILEPCERRVLSLADVVVLVQYVGLQKATAFVTSVDPWRFAGDGNAASPAIRGRIQSVVDAAVTAGKNFSEYSEENIASYLLSPLLVPKGDRPPLVRLRLPKQSVSTVEPIRAAQRCPKAAPAAVEYAPPSQHGPRESLEVSTPVATLVEPKYIVITVRS